MFDLGPDSTGRDKGAVERGRPAAVQLNQTLPRRSQENVQVAARLRIQSILHRIRIQGQVFKILKKFKYDFRMIFVNVLPYYKDLYPDPGDQHHSVT